MSDKAFEDLYAAALRASGSTGTATTDAERRRRLREIVWDAMRTYGHGARHEEEGVRRVWGVKFKGIPGVTLDGVDMIEIDKLPDAALRLGALWFAHLPLNAPPYLPNPTVADFHKKKATIYKAGDMGFGYRKTEVSSYFHQLRPYAQYPQAHEVLFLPKGARNPRHYYDTYKPSTIILEGWGHPDPAGIMTGATGGVSRRSFDPAWKNEFDNMIDAYVKSKGVKVLLDIRQGGE